MRLSKFFLKTLRVAPLSSESQGYKMLLRAGYIKQIGSGIFDILPLGLKSIRKIENIIRSEMDNIGGQECLFPVVNPADLWKETGRYFSIGSELTRFTDRKDSPLVLGMTHEECATDAARYVIDSHKKMPLMIYQIQTKWRDDPRPRAGLIRVREFTMKDAYSFDKDYEGLEKSYNDQYKAYFRIFERVGLKTIAVLSDSGMMGGKISHEYMYLSPLGEDTIIHHDECGYTANKQVATFKKEFFKEELKELKEVNTPGTKTIEDLCALLKIYKEKTAKAVFFTGTFKKENSEDVYTKLITCIIRGDLDVEESKVQNTAKAQDLRPAVDEEIISCGMVPGFASPIGVDTNKIILLVDESAAYSNNLVAGANKEDTHFINSNYNRDYKGGVVCDIATAKEGYICPKCEKGALKADRGVEVGNIFQLGTRYSESMNLYFQDTNGERKPVVMGCYGIGVGRLLGCLAEEYSDEKGLCLPASVAPYQVHLVSLLKDNTECDKIYETLLNNNIEVLYDDRAENAGVKFNDSELIGCPVIVTVGNKGLLNGTCEVKTRKNMSEVISVKISELPQTLNDLLNRL